MNSFMISDLFDPNSPIAAIETPDTIFYASYRPKPQEPHSAVTQLIQGMYEAHLPQALKILRSPIILNYAPSLLCRGMIAIAGKRFRADPHFFERKQTKPLVPITYKSSVNTLDESSISALTFSEIKDWIQLSPLQTSLLKKVRAVLLNEQKAYLLSAESEAPVNKTLHAEVVLLQKYFALHQKGFSSPTLLMTNLQSCKMCAAMWWHMHSDPWKNLKSIYTHPELGPSARDTLLTSGGNWRREIASNPQELHQVLEFPLETGDFENKP